MIKYNEFVEQLKEGLIRTYDMRKYKTTLDINLRGCGIITNIIPINKFVFELEFVSKVTKRQIDYTLNTIQNLFGYIPSFYHITLVNNMNRSNKYEEKSFNSDIEKDYKYLKLVFEAKYEDSLTKNTNIVPDICYHLTPDNKTEKILKYGLESKANYRKSNHDQRIYLFVNICEYEDLLEKLKINDLMNNDEKTYSLLEIDLSERKDIVLHTDPNYIKGFFAYDNIAPHTIKILKSNL